MSLQGRSQPVTAEFDRRVPESEVWSASVASVSASSTHAEVLFYVHRNRRFIRDGSPGRPPRLSHSP